MIHLRIPVFHMQMDAVYPGKEVAKESATILPTQRKNTIVATQQYWLKSVMSEFTSPLYLFTRFH